MKMHLTNLTIRNLKPDGAQRLFYCDQTPNFGVRISQAGAKTFFVNLGKERHRKSLGRWPHTQLAEARLRAKQLLVSPYSPKPAITVADALTTYRTTYLEPNYKPRSLVAAVRLLTSYLDTVLPLSINAVAPQHIHAILDTLVDRPSEANHAYAAFKTFFNWCVRRHLIQTSPVTGSKPHKTPARDRVLSPAELVAVWRACRGDTFGRIVKMLILSAQRKSEITTLEWKDYSPTALTFRDTKPGTTHVLPCTPKMRAIIESQPRRNDYVFPGQIENKPFNAFSDTKRELEQRCKVENWTLHDLRRTAASTMASLQIPPIVIEKILNHKIPGVAGIYNRHTYAHEMREALIKYDSHLNRLLIGDTEPVDR